jgi:aspartate carbamoyltransferase catalytic subunit
VIVEQVANGVIVRMAVLYLLLGGSESGLGELREGEGSA